MAIIEIKGGVLRFVGGKVDGLKVRTGGGLRERPGLGNRNFAQLPDGRVVLGGILSVEQEDEERYKKKMGIA